MLFETIMLTQLQVSAWRIAQAHKNKNQNMQYKLLKLDLVGDLHHVIELLILCHFVVISLWIALY